MVYGKRPPLDEQKSLWEASLAVEGVTTGAGAVTGDSFIDAGLAGAGANSFVSMLAVVYPGQPQLVDSMDITAFNNVTGEVTLSTAYKGVAAAIPAGVPYKIVTFRFVPAEVAAIEAKLDRALFTMDFWSDSVEEKVITAAQATAAVGSPIVVADLPAGATVVRAIVMFKFRMVENTNAAENSLDATAPLPIQIDDVANTGWLTAIDFVDEQFKIAATTREGGDVIIGDNDVAARVDGNDTYDFQWLNAKAHLANIQFNDVQMGIRIWYSV